jgi:hypothetical protein
MRTCAHCSKEFEPRYTTLQAVCGPRCARAKVSADKRAAKQSERAAERHSKRNDREKLLKLQPISYFEKKAEKAVNAYVRMRDYHRGCCSCDKPATWPGKWNASHLRSVGAASAVRFNLWNIAKACVQCNMEKSGNLGEYLPRAIARMGQQRVDWLYAQNAPVKRTREDLERMAAVFNKKARRAKKRLGVV